jgi:hypothetical protein
VNANDKQPTVSELPAAPLKRTSRWHYVRWACFLLVAYATITYFTVHRQWHPLKVYQSTHPGLNFPHELELVEIYPGQQSYVGWPLRWLVYREEAEEPSPYAPLRLVQAKFSVIALALDLTGLIALVILGVQLSQTLRGSAFTWRRGVLMLICLAIVISIVPLTQYDFVGDIPTTSP